MIRWLLVLLLLAAPAGAAEIQDQGITIADHPRSYLVYVPDSVKSPAPLLVLLHGSSSPPNQPADYLIKLWRAKADREGIILLAPRAFHVEGWQPRLDGPRVIGLMIEAVKAHAPVDPRRVYLFGQSGGAVYALSLAMLESRYFAAMSIHAGSWRHPDDFKQLALAQRHIPMEILIGDKDEYFSLTSVRETIRALDAKGFPTELHITPGQHHGLSSDIAPQVGDDAWSFLKDKALDAEPLFQDYGL